MTPEVPAPRSNAITHKRFYPRVASCDICELEFTLEFFLGQRRDGVFVEVGAYDGITYSNTYGLAMMGWRGLCIEPNPVNAALCRATHENHDVRVLEVAISAPGVDTLTFELGGPLTTSNRAVADESRFRSWAQGRLQGQRVDLPAMTLPALLDAHGIATDFELLVVDVEGASNEVFHEFEHWAYRPQMIIVELFDLNPDVAAVRRVDHALQLRIERIGYEIAFKDPLNTMFVRNDVSAAAFARGPKP